MYKLVYTAEAKSQIDKLHASAKSQLKGAVEKIGADPFTGKRLSHELSGFMSYRSGVYRVIYKIFHKEVIVMVLTVGHRKDVYKKAARKLT